jgi:integrase
VKTHIATYGTAADGRLFRTALGGDFSPSAYWRAWQAARRYAIPPEAAGGPLAGHPYDLRHGGVTLWLNAGVPPPRWHDEPDTASTSC